ncbi:hypothetical protein KUTeg_018397 [Tegillarca granosa]|uniref:Uncharacterized protein n=1 Tax=Tegillarca granosa TaxID=220873 RepID=A0ABQ9EJ69_TEGGR|nr:hypothetical protein KUTeg_018397 [Tegillarca granosa]
MVIIYEISCTENLRRMNKDGCLLYVHIQVKEKNEDMNKDIINISNVYVVCFHVAKIQIYYNNSGQVVTKLSVIIYRCLYQDSVQKILKN